MYGLGLGIQLPVPPGFGTAVPVVPEIRTLPVVTGSGAAGTAIAGNAGIWHPSTGVTLAWSWQRNGADIAGGGGTGPAVAPYAVAAGDHGAPIRLRVTATTAAGSATAFSTALTAFVPAPVATPGGWTIALARGRAMAPLDLSVGFTGLALAFSVAAGGTLPAGLVLSAAGVLSGTPTADGVSSVSVRAANAGGNAAKAVSLTVLTAAFVADYAAGSYSPDGVAAVAFAGLHDYSRAGTATRLRADGTIEVVAANQPRFDHLPGGTPLGLLVEPAGTNALLWSEELTTGWTVSGATVSAAGLSVRGRWAGRVLASAGNTSNRIGQTLTLTAGVPLTVRVFFRYGLGAKARLAFRNTASGVESVIRGAQGGLAVTATAAGAVTGLSEETQADAVTILTATFAPSVSGSHQVGFGPNSAVAGETVILLAVQTLDGSYVPTTTAAAARAADVVALRPAAPGLYDAVLTYGDLTQERLEEVAVGATWFPALARREVRRIEGDRLIHEPLGLESGARLSLESGAALELEIPR